MEKIKILFYSHTIDYGGTWRSHERILMNIDKNLFDPYIIYREEGNNNRLEFLLNNFNKNNILSFKADNIKTGPNEGYSYINTNFYTIINKYNFDIIHFARSGYYEWPFVKRICPIQIETNIFAGKDKSNFLDYSVSICETIDKLRGGSDEIIYNPIPKKIDDNINLKTELNIGKDYVILGRIGRPDNFTPISFNALKLLKNDGIKFKYIIIGACDRTKNIIGELDLTDECIILNETNDDYLIHKFYNTLDIFAHYRSDGECHSTAISQAMMYKLPIITHYAGFNGQIETIKEGGFVVNNEVEYYNKIKSLINDKDLYKKISDYSFKRSDDFEMSHIIKKWENLYKKLYNNKHT